MQRSRKLRALVDEFFRGEHQLGFYAGKLGMTVDRLNDHVKRATGVTAGHLIRQRVLTEAKRQLVFTDAADPGYRPRARVFRSLALCPVFPQAYRHDAA
jgi:AraC-like DNA-binding protein